MSKSAEKLVDDIARLALGAVDAAQGMKGEAGQMVRRQLEKALGELDLVSREEFDVLRDMVTALRADNAALLARLDEAGQAKTVKKPAAAKPSTRTTAKRKKKTAN